MRWSSSIRTSYEEQRYKKWEFLAEISNSYSRLQNESYCTIKNTRCEHKRQSTGPGLSKHGESRHLDGGTGYTLGNMFFFERTWTEDSNNHNIQKTSKGNSYVIAFSEIWYGFIVLQEVVILPSWCEGKRKVCMLICHIFEKYLILIDQNSNGGTSLRRSIKTFGSYEPPISMCWEQQSHKYMMV